VDTRAAVPVWPFRKKKSFPSYTLLKSEPSCGLPQGLSDQEDSDDFNGTVERIRADLLARSPSHDLENFAIFVKFGEGLLELQLPEGKCLLVFSTMVRAADYISVQVPDIIDQLAFFSSTPRNAVQVIQHFRQHAGISLLALDRCPRCNIFATLNACSMDTPANLIGAWAISVSREIGRRDLYWNHARSLAREGKLLSARDLALEMVGHVTPADARTHLLLGKLAIRLKDRELYGEVRDFLEFLGEPGAVRELQTMEKTSAWQF
jgi:hypothetical protein